MSLPVPLEVRKPDIKKGFCNYSRKPEFTEACLLEAPLFSVQANLYDTHYICQACMEKVLAGVPHPEPYKRELPSRLTFKSVKNLEIVKPGKYSKPNYGYTEEQEKWLKEKAGTAKFKDILSEFNKMFGTKKIRMVLYMKVKSMGLPTANLNKVTLPERPHVFVRCLPEYKVDVKKDVLPPPVPDVVPEEPVKNIIENKIERIELMPKAKKEQNNRIPFTTEQDEFLNSCTTQIPYYGNFSKVVKQFNEKFKLDKSEMALKSRLSRLKGKKGVKTPFAKPNPETDKRMIDKFAEYNKEQEQQASKALKDLARGEESNNTKLEASTEEKLQKLQISVIDAAKIIEDKSVDILNLSNQIENLNALLGEKNAEIHRLEKNLQACENDLADCKNDLKISYQENKKYKDGEHLYKLLNEDQKRDLEVLNKDRDYLKTYNKNLQMVLGSSRELLKISLEKIDNHIDLNLFPTARKEYSI